MWRFRYSSGEFYILYMNAVNCLHDVDNWPSGPMITLLLVSAQGQSIRILNFPVPPRKRFSGFLANTARFHCLAGRVSSIYSAHFWVFRAGFWSERSERSRVPPGSELCIGHIKAPPVVQAGIVFTRKIGGFAEQWTFILCSREC